MQIPGRWESWELITTGLYSYTICCQSICWCCVCINKHTGGFDCSDRLVWFPDSSSTDDQGEKGPYKKSLGTRVVTDGRILEGALFIQQNVATFTSTNYNLTLAVASLIAVHFWCLWKFTVSRVVRCFAYPHSQKIVHRYTSTISFLSSIHKPHSLQSTLNILQRKTHKMTTCRLIVATIFTVAQCISYGTAN